MPAAWRLLRREPVELQHQAEQDDELSAHGRRRGEDQQVLPAHHQRPSQQGPAANDRQGAQRQGGPDEQAQDPALPGWFPRQRLPGRSGGWLHVPGRHCGVRPVRPRGLLFPARRCGLAAEPVGGQDPLDVPELLVQFPTVVGRGSAAAAGGAAVAVFIAASEPKTPWQRGQQYSPPLRASLPGTSCPHCLHHIVFQESAARLANYTDSVDFPDDV